MALLGPQVVFWSVAVAACAFILHHTGYRPLKSQQTIEAHLGLYDTAADTPDTFVVYAGRLLFFAATLAWAVVIAQSLVSAVRRYRHTPAAVPPLQPLNPEEIEQQKSQPQTAASSGPQQPSDTAQSIKPQQQPQQQQQQRSDRERGLEAQRRRVADEKQRQFDEAAAARKQQQEREDAERKIRATAAAAQATAQAAALHRHQEQQQQQARAAEQRQWELWEQAVLQQYRRSDGAAGSSSSSNFGGAAPPAAAAAAGVSNRTAADIRIAAAAAAADQDRQLRQQQDHEYQASLAADQQRQQHKRQQQNLKHLKQLLQEKYAAIGVINNGSNGLPDGGLSVRVKLPDGGSAVRTFAADQSLAGVYDWVFSLDTMPCLAPGSWYLSTTYPKQKILPAGGVWSPGGCRADGMELQQYIHELQLTADGGGGGGGGGTGLWGLSVRQLTGEELVVLVRDDSTVFDVKEKVQLQTGAPPDAQRLIFSGRILPDDSTLQQLGITADHTLQLATALVPQPQPSSPGRGQLGGLLASPQNGDGDKADAGALGVLQTEAGGSVEVENSTVSSELCVSDVRQLRAEVADGASQLVLYVVTEGV